MGDSRRHRGPHPADEELFSEDALPRLRNAVEELSWLRSRGYAEASALKLVGDRYQLRRRQRVAVGRCACSDAAKARRASKLCEPGAVMGRPLLIDGLNVITTIEVALAGGVLLLGRDGCMRDMASFHGSYRMVHESERAVAILVDVVEAMKPLGSQGLHRPASFELRPPRGARSKDRCGARLLPRSDDSRPRGRAPASFHCGGRQRRQRDTRPLRPLAEPVPHRSRIAETRARLVLASRSIVKAANGRGTRAWRE